MTPLPVKRTCKSDIRPPAKPDPEKDAPYMRTGLFAAVRDEEQDAGHDAEYGEDDAAEMDQSREDQPDARKDVRPGLHKEVP